MEGVGEEREGGGDCDWSSSTVRTAFVLLVVVSFFSFSISLAEASEKVRSLASTLKHTS
jgi:hypothetical protein